MIALLDRLPEPGAGCLMAGIWPARRPLLLSSPHSGARYSDRFSAYARLPCERLTGLQDGPVHRLLGFAGRLGLPLIHAEYSRAVVDLNRSPSELLPFLLERPGSRRVKVTGRSRAGLGVIPTRMCGEAIYEKALPADELSWRIDVVHARYHQTLAACHAASARHFGSALLLDCHSMPRSVARLDGRLIDIVLGNCRGTACTAAILTMARDYLQRQGLRVTVNEPYAGGYITQYHGRPRAGRLAMQIELRRDLFMDEETQSLTADAACLGRVLEGLCHELSHRVSAASRVDAA